MLSQPEPPKRLDNVTESIVAESSKQTTVVDKKPRLVYLDVCALNRPLDDQSQMRIRLEADAVALISATHVHSRLY